MSSHEDEKKSTAALPSPAADISTLTKHEKIGSSNASAEHVLALNPADSRDEVYAFARRDVSWSEDEERALVWRLDLRIIPLVTLLYLCNFIDRTNVGNAKVAGLDADLGLVGYQYNIGLSVFYIAYSFTEVPSNLMLKRVGGTRWLPTLVLGFGLVCFSTAFITNFRGFMTIRVLLGLCEGGMMPGITYYLSNWYKRHELALRVGIFVSAASLSGAFGGLLATAFLSIPQLKGLPHGQWRNIFLIEGVLTIAIALMAYFVLPQDPKHNGFLNEREQLIATERIRVENAGLNEQETTDWKLVARAWTSMTNWICALAFLLCNITVQGIALFMPTLLAGMGNSKIQSQLKTVPPYIVSSIWSIAIAYACQRSGRRGLWVLISAPISVVGSAMLIGSKNRKVEYAGIFFLAMGIFPLGPIFLAWGSNNSAPYTTRAISSAMIVGIGSLGPIVSAWIYLPHDGPRYIKGLSVQLGGQVAIIVIIIFLMLWLARENRLRRAGKRDYRLDGDKTTVMMLGNKHPKFRLTI